MAEQFFYLRVPTHERGRQDTYIYKRLSDGFIFECTTKEAAQKEKVPALYKQVGFTDGAVFYAALENLIKIQDEALENIGGVEPDIKTDSWKKARREIAKETERAYRKLLEDTRKSADGNYRKPASKDVEVFGNQSLMPSGVLSRMLRR